MNVISKAGLALSELSLTMLVSMLLFFLSLVGYLVMGHFRQKTCLLQAFRVIFHT